MGEIYTLLTKNDLTSTFENLFFLFKTNSVQTFKLIFWKFSFWVMTFLQQTNEVMIIT